MLLRDIYRQKCQITLATAAITESIAYHVFTEAPLLQPGVCMKILWQGGARLSTEYVEHHAGQTGRRLWHMGLLKELGDPTEIKMCAT